MKRDLNPNAATPVIAAALRRGRRVSPRKGGGGTAAQNPTDNYVAEGRVTHRFRSKKRKKAGARTGNLNAVRFPLKTPEDIDFYRRFAAVMKSAKSLVRAINSDLRERRKGVSCT